MGWAQYSWRSELSSEAALRASEGVRKSGREKGAREGRCELDGLERRELWYQLSRGEWVERDRWGELTEPRVGGGDERNV